MRKLGCKMCHSYHFERTGKYCNEITGVAIVKMRRCAHRFVCTVIPFITDIGSENVQLHTLRTTGTIHKAYIHLKASIPY